LQIFPLIFMLRSSMKKPFFVSIPACFDLYRP